MQNFTDGISVTIVWFDMPGVPGANIILKSFVEQARRPSFNLW